jgi:hypothetical protein
VSSASDDLRREALQGDLDDAYYVLSHSFGSPEAQESARIRIAQLREELDVARSLT